MMVTYNMFTEIPMLNSIIHHHNLSYQVIWAGARGFSTNGHSVDVAHRAKNAELLPQFHWKIFLVDQVKFICLSSLDPRLSR